MASLGYKTLREQVVASIREKITNHEYVPGDRIIEQNLAEEYGISRGPIREALRQLEQEGLVEYARNAGCSVKRITMKDAYEICMLRMNYELIVLSLLGGELEESVIKGLEAIVEKMKDVSEDDVTAFSKLNHEFHRIIVTQKNFTRIIKSWDELNYDSLTGMISSANIKRKIMLGHYEEHKKLVEIFKSGKLEDKTNALYMHYMLPIYAAIVDAGENMNDFYFPTPIEL